MAIIGRRAKRRASRPGATAWDKVSALEPTETTSHRDVHADQQLDRGHLGRRRSNTLGVIGASIVGALVLVAVWTLYSFVTTGIVTVGASIGTAGRGDDRPLAYYSEEPTTGPDGATATCYRPLTESGQPDIAAGCFSSAEDVPVPAWWTGRPGPEEEANQEAAPVAAAATSFSEQLSSFTGFKVFMTLTSSLGAALAIGSWSGRRVAAANLMTTTSDINQHHNDQHIALPQEIQRRFDWFPDAGAHSAVQPNSLISHNMLTRKGLGTVTVPVRATEDVHDAEDGELLHYAGETMTDDDGAPLTSTVPLIDEDFGTALFDASGLPGDKGLRIRYDARRIPYNPDGKDRNKIGRFSTVADLIRHDWVLPEYEVQRPAGAYLVDNGPVNTMVLAMTRAGKGQTYIEPIIDMWSREKNPSNMVLNDPKGELLRTNYIPFVMRGFEPVQFNLINPMKTDIYNPLGMAADAAREGDTTKCAMYVENIGEVFFPITDGEDPVWPVAANNAFKRAAYGLIDYYLEEERELREAAAATGMDPQTLEQVLDDMWGKVTLYNCYQLFVQLTSKKLKNPIAVLEARIKAGEFDDDENGLAIERESAEAQEFLWDGKGELDLLTLYFNATQALPRNTMRTRVADAHNSLVSMAGAEKMLSSVYGIAITGMSFFTDPRISTLTSGKPSQNIDLAGLSFPRRLGVRFAPNFLKRDHLVGLRAIWRAYEDPSFAHDLGEDFGHEDLVGREGWARYNFKGIFPQDEAWLKLELVNPETGMLVRTFRFHFRKSYQLSLSGRHFVIEPVTGKKVVKNGILRELVPVAADGARGTEGTAYGPGDTTYPHGRLVPIEGGDGYMPVEGRARAIMQTMVRYGESPKAVFLVTPPHLMKYAKLVLILVKQLVDVSFDQSYMTKANQKPLYRTRFMLDELGNLQSDGKGIAGFETMLSIGLGQEQQFTLILQTLQQLRDVYGDSVDKIVQGNVSNIIFLKSTDDSMIETLEKMGGKTHRSHLDSKSVSKDVEKMLGGKTEGRVQYTMSTKEEPLISYNDMAFISERNSIVFRAGDPPVWNRGPTILPMAHRLLEDRVVHDGREYNLQTIPTLSSAMEFDVRRNQPDFRKMLELRMRQAVHAEAAKKVYAASYDYEDVDVERLDPDVYSEEVMGIVQTMVNAEKGRDPHAPVVIDPDEYAAISMFLTDDRQLIEDVEMASVLEEQRATEAKRQLLMYAEGTISKEMLVNPDGSAKVKALDLQIAEAYKSARTELEHDRAHFTVGGDGELRSADGTRTYISQMRSDAYEQAIRRLDEHSRAKGSRVFADPGMTADDLGSFTSVTVHADFYGFLASLPTWEPLADGHFDRAMAIEMRSAD